MPASDAAAARTRYRIDLAYDGAPFAGFARQRDQVTVQGELETAAARLFGQPVALTGAGRTDRGVHALAQVVHLDVDPTVPRAARASADLAQLRARLDQQVGRAITIWQVRPVPLRFDARFSATARRYRYRLVDAPMADPIHRHDRWHLGEALQLAAMRAGARHLIGEHEFASFCRRSPGRTTVRRLDRLTLSRSIPGRIDVVLDAPAFCHQQVRSIVGCLVEVGRGRRRPDWIAEVLAAEDRGAAARVAPPHGLTLEQVRYGRAWPASPPVGVRVG
ncbi:MAG: tRNA pseudouridine(38-40) synthase TruA [Nitriliruptoraceae bacterium]